MSGEIWKPTEQYPGYQVSTQGNVKGILKTTLKQHIDRGGYARVSALNAHTHVLVAKAFIPNPQALPFVGHVDHDKTNNAVENLRWLKNDATHGDVHDKPDMSAASVDFRDGGRNLPDLGEKSEMRETPGISFSPPARKGMPAVPIASLSAAVKANPAVIQHIDVDEIQTHLNHDKDAYEITWIGDGDEKQDASPYKTMCRAYLDIDGCMAPDTEEADFDVRDESILSALEDMDFGTPFSIMTASKYNNKDFRDGKPKHKLSYRLTFTNKCGLRDEVKYWSLNVAGVKLAEVLNSIIPFFPLGKPSPAPEEYLDCDAGVYSRQRKMRCWNTTKPGEARPNKLVRGENVLDTLITYVPEGCERLPPAPKPVVSVAQAVAPAPTVSVTPTAVVGDKALIQKVVESLPAHLSDDYAIWLSVGMACFNEELPMEVWDAWSSRSAKYRAGECAYRWSTFRRGTISQSYVWAQLKKHDTAKFKELVCERKDFERMMENPTHYAVAEFFHNTCPHDYLYDSASGWFGVLPSGVWENPKAKAFPPTMKNKIVRVLNNERFQLESVLSKRKRTVANNDEISQEERTATIEALDKKTKKLLEFRDKYENDGFQKGVVAFLASFYAEQTQLLIESKGASAADGVLAVFDTNPNVWAFTDCLYDFTTREFRPIQPTDYITITCGYARPHTNPAVRKKMMDTLLGIWEDAATAEYMLGLLSVCLNGTRDMEVFTILTGRGGNGKGLLWELVQNAFGGYYYALPVQSLTKKIDSATAATPDIANLRGRRCVGTSEPEAEETLQEGTIKLLTGGDKLTGRPLYGQPFTFKPQFGLFIQCNNIPTFNGITKGGVRRNRVVPFPFNFVGTPQLSYERHGDPHIKNVLCRSEQWRDEFLCLLLDTYPKYAGKQIDQVAMPPMVANRTNEYTEENNQVGVWWLEHYEVSEGHVVLSMDALTAFKDETKQRITDRTFKSALAFNDVDIVKFTKSDYENHKGVKGRMGIVNWRRKAAADED